jgi:hypothetical protein
MDRQDKKAKLLFFYVFYPVHPVHPVHPVYLCEYFFRKHFLYLGQKIRLACPSM